MTTQERTPNHLRKALTRQKLLDSALDVFADTGYHEASVDEIVKASGTSKGAFYFHFPSKGGLFVSLMDTLADRIARDVERSVAARQTTIERIDAALDTVVDLFTRHRTVARVFLVDVPTHNKGFDTKLRQIHDRFAAMIQRYLDEAVADGSIDAVDTRILARMWMGSITEVVTWWLTEPKAATPAQLRQTMRQILLRTIAPPGGEVSTKDSSS